MTSVPPGRLVEVTRRAGDVEVVESVHVGDLVVVGPGGIVHAVGDHERPVFVRSAAKPFQATACLELLAEHGPVTPDELSDAELAVAWASHRGERRHLRAVRRLLARSGTTEQELTCPPTIAEADTVWPPASPGRPPDRLRFNCSGKHALFALAGRGLGLAGAALVDPGQPLQSHVLEVLDSAIGPLHGHGIDGCGAPAVVVPLASLAQGYGALAVGGRWARVRDAGLREPGLVGGDGRLETALLGAGVVAKVGAEGVYAAGWVDAEGRPHGVAVKAHDGAVRGAATALHGVLVGMGVVEAEVWSPPAVTGGDAVVGVVRAVAGLAPPGRPGPTPG